MGANLVLAISQFIPEFSQIVGLIAVMSIFLAASVIGAAGCGQNRFASLDVVAGFGIISSIFVVFGVLFWVPFQWLAALVAVVTVGCLIVYFSAGHRREKLLPGDLSVLWKVLVLALPIVILVSAMRASQWDEFSQWLPNAIYLLRFDAFPRSDLPVSPSSFAAYPYGIQLIIYMASRLSGHFVENGGAIANLTLLLFMAPVFLSVVNDGLGISWDWRKRWSSAALGLLGVTILSTTFVQKITLTAYADSATGVVLAALSFLGWKIVSLLANDGSGAMGREDVSPTGLAWQFGICAIFLIFLKQANPVLLVLVLTGIGLAALRDPNVRVSQFIRLLPLMIGPAILIYVTWRYHVNTHLAGKEFGIMSRESWLLSDAFYILGKMATAAAKKSGYAIMMVSLPVCGLVALFRFKGRFHRYAIIVGTVFVGYNLFLWMMYVIAFGAYEGKNVASFWRYNTQLGLMGALCAAYGLAILWKRYVTPRLVAKEGVRKNIAYFVIFLVLVAPFVGAKKIRVDIRPYKDHIRHAGQELAAMLPAGSKLTVVDQQGNGLARMIMRYELLTAVGLVSAPKVKHISSISVFTGAGSSEKIRRVFDRNSTSHIWVHKSLPMVEDALGQKLSSKASHLLVKKSAGWELVKSWPYVGYDDPFAPTPHD